MGKVQGKRVTAKRPCEGACGCPGAPSAGEIFGDLLTMQLAEDRLHLALLFVAALPADRQERWLWLRQSRARHRRSRFWAQLCMGEWAGTQLLVNRAERRPSSASPPWPSGHDEPLRTGDGSIAKGASSTTGGRSVFVWCIEMAGARGAVIMWSIPLFVLALLEAPSAGRCAINPPTPMQRYSSRGLHIRKGPVSLRSRHWMPGSDPKEMGDEQPGPSVRVDRRLGFSEWGGRRAQQGGRLR